MSVQEVLHGDMRDIMVSLIDQRLQVESVITDPPYHLQSITKRFGKPDSAPAKHGRDGAAARLSKGFMGLDWDGGEIAFDPATWQLCWDVMKPGARLLAFGGSRTFWKIAAAIDGAGFECEDTIFWAYGQGLVLRRSRMKPAIEPVLVFRKPGPVRDLNIDECRIEWPDGKTPSIGTPEWGGPQKKLTAMPGQQGPTVVRTGPHAKGRWPANLVHDGSDEVLECFPDAPGQIADASADAPSNRTGSVYGDMRRGDDPMPTRADSGSAARFFNRCEWTAEEQIERIAYQAKAPGAERVFRCTICGEDFFRADRDRHIHGKYLPSGEVDWSHLHSHPTLKPLSLMQYLVRLVTPPDGVVLDCFCGTGSTLVAARRAGRDAIGIERDERYAAHARLRLANESA